MDLGAFALSLSLSVFRCASTIRRARGDELYIEVVALALLAADFYFEWRVAVVVVVVAAIAVAIACVLLITLVY